VEGLRVSDRDTGSLHRPRQDIAWLPFQVHRIYRSRFAIELSYRMRNQVRPRTRTRKPVPLCNHFISAEKRLDRSTLDTPLDGKAGAAND